MAAGFPHIEVTPSNRSLAYECVLIYEVVTKRIPVLDDLRKGLDAVRVMATTVIDLAQQHHEVQQYIFPGATSKIKVAELRQQFKYETPTDDKTAKAAEHFEKYLDELYVRGTFSFIGSFSATKIEPVLKFRMSCNLPLLNFNTTLTCKDSC